MNLVKTSDNIRKVNSSQLLDAKASNQLLKNELFEMISNKKLNKVSESIIAEKVIQLMDTL